ncbi:glycosyltransferase [Dactylosporangium sp. NPDC049525]|uniref:glycosyltransferase family 2 protein n=1 Tax=Dactylosporangium sp. NPDC049525 TaxID=3154730 RepID=UPI00343E8CA1
MSSISVVMPTCGKPGYLAYTLASLSVQTDRNFQLIVVDDDDGTSRATVQQYRADVHLVYLSQKNAGRSAARNTGIGAADGDHVLFLDDDRIAAPDLVAQHHSAQRHSSGVVIGWKSRCLTSWRRDALPMQESDFLQLATRHPAIAARMAVEDFDLITPADIHTDHAAALDIAGLGDDGDNYPQIVRRYGTRLTGFRLPWVLGTTANLSVPRALLEDVGGFDEQYHGWGMEDTDLSYRLHRAGAPFRVEPSAVNWHQIHPLGPGPLRRDLRRRETDLTRNLARFCDRHRTVETYLYWRKWKSKLSLEAASDLLDVLDRAGSDTWRAELLDTYATLVATDLAAP